MHRSAESNQYCVGEGRDGMYIITVLGSIYISIELY